MIEVLETIFDWSEVWALLLPLAVLIVFRSKDQHTFLRPVKFYVYMALILNLAANIIYNQKQLNLNLPWHNNVLIYNAHSLARLFMFAWFFNSLKQPFLRTIKKVLPLLFLIFIVINFTMFESLIGNSISPKIHILEAFLLLFYCLQYYLYLLKEEQISYKQSPSFWIVTGLGIFVFTNFPVYLFYNPMTSRDVEFAIYIWKVHKIAHIIFCAFLAKAFYESRR